MNKNLIHFSTVVSLIFMMSCSGSGTDDNNSVEEQSLYGGVFKMPIGSYFNPIRVVEVQKLETAQIYDQMLEGLVKYNPKTLEVEASLASDWKISEDGLTYTFTLA
jgi:ABC-type oligopeptide transport system substrate-binding subunit